MKRWQRVAVGAAVAAGIFVVGCPFFLSAYGLRVLTNIFMFAILSQALNIITGYTGYPAFGNVVFFGLGAYTTGVMMVKLHMPFVLTIPVGIAVCALFTLLFGLPVLRLRGHYFAIATLGLNEATRAVVDNLTGLTGGGMGLSLPLPPWPMETTTRFFYFVMLGTMVLSLLATFVFSRGRLGYGCRSIRADEAVARSMGINTTLYKTAAWMISAALTGITGCVYAYWMSYIEPSAVFDMMIAIKTFVMFLIGGAGTMLGPILGAFFVEMLSTFVWGHLLDFHLAVLGVIIMIIVILMPKGLMVFMRDRLYRTTFRGVMKRGKAS